MKELTLKLFLFAETEFKKDIKKNTSCSRVLNRTERFKHEGLIVEIKLIDPQGEFDEHQRIIGKNQKIIDESTEILDERYQAAQYLINDFPELEDKI